LSLEAGDTYQAGRAWWRSERRIHAAVGWVGTGHVPDAEVSWPDIPQARIRSRHRAPACSRRLALTCRRGLRRPKNAGAAELGLAALPVWLLVLLGG
jgi:hypothetical protein